MNRLTAITAALALFCVGAAQAQTSPGLVSPNQVVAGPSSGVNPGLPSGRTLVGADIPFLGTMATQNANNVDITGGIVTGLPTPTGSADAATKMYVDSVAAGLIIHSQALLATAAALPTNTYNNGTAGVGATLTATTNGALTVDGVLTTTSIRIVVKNEATIANCGGGSVVGCSNGIYVVTTVGDGSHPYVLTRATDANTPGPGSPTEIGLGTFVFVISGTANGNTGWSVNSVVTTIGTSAINWVQFSGGSASGVTSLGGMSGILSCGSNISCTGSTVSVAAAGSNGQVQANNSGVLGGLTNTQLSALINPFSSSLSGAVPSSGGGTTNFLRADGTWDAPIACCAGYQTSGISTVPLTGGTVSSQGILNNSIALFNTASTYNNQGTLSSYVDFSSITNPGSCCFASSNFAIGVKSGTGAPNAFPTALATSVNDFSGDNNETISLSVANTKNNGAGVGTSFGIGLQMFDDTTGTITRNMVGMELDLFGSGSRQGQNNGLTIFCLSNATPHFCGQGSFITTDGSSAFDWGYRVKGNISTAGAAFDTSTANLQSNIALFMDPLQRIQWNNLHGPYITYNASLIRFEFNIDGTVVGHIP